MSRIRKTVIFTKLCWHLGGFETDVANLKAENIDWTDRVISYARRKTRSQALIHFGPAVEAILHSLPAQGHLFPEAGPMKEKYRGQEFKRGCVKLGIMDVTLHCYADADLSDTSLFSDYCRRGCPGVFRLDRIRIFSKI